MLCCIELAMVFWACLVFVACILLLWWRVIPCVYCRWLTPQDTLSSPWWLVWPCLHCPLFLQPTVSTWLAVCWELQPVAPSAWRCAGTNMEIFNKLFNFQSRIEYMCRHYSVSSWIFSFTFMDFCWSQICFGIVFNDCTLKRNILCNRLITKLKPTSAQTAVADELSS